MTPTRIQRRRVKGWRMPDGAVSVTRPSIWGNPFVVAAGSGEHSKTWAVYCEEWNHATQAGPWWLWSGGPIWFADKRAAAQFAIALFRAWAILLVEFEDVDLAELRGRDLCCWCKEGEPCHADVLLEIANR